MKIPLTLEQRRFLVRCQELYEKNEITSLPHSRIRNILMNGCYYDDMSSYKDIPTQKLPNSMSADKNKLNQLANRIRAYYKSLKE